MSEIRSSFQIIVTEGFRVDPRYTGVTQEQLDWLLQNFFWHGVCTDDGNYILTFHLPLPLEQEELTE